MSENHGHFIFSIAAIMENPSGEILLLKRSANNSPGNIWDIVGGGVKRFEDPFDALTREILEETGIIDYDIMKAIDVFSNLPTLNKFPGMIGITFWCKTDCKEINLSYEHSDFKWVKPLKALTIVEHPTVKHNLECFICEKLRLGLTVK
ncbi:MAG: NUDIX domain-containing protein [Candidatus Heimdallarchaeota archaeon]|nr:NUDIX domain-containing protein [Candidatus Heimdallarchaeota archaeon]